MKTHNKIKKNKCFLDQWVDDLAGSFTAPGKKVTIKYFHKLMTVMLMLLVGIGTGTTPAATYAFYNDTETSAGENFSAGILDFNISWGDWDNPVLATDLEIGESVSRTLVINPAADPLLPFVFDMMAENLAGTGCNDLLVSVKNENDEVLYTGSLADLEITNQDFSIDNDHFIFTHTLAQDADTFGACSYDVTVQGYLSAFSFGVAFYDEETTGNAVTTTETIISPPALAPVVLNEVLAKPHDASDGPTGEWVELYNLSDSEYIDIAGWEISEISGSNEKKYIITANTADGNHVRTYTGSTVIAPNGFIVILFAGKKLNDKDETITLYDQYGNKLDQYSYEDAKLGMSDARIPDGTGDWVDPIPSPGLPNITDLGSEEFNQSFNISGDFESQSGFEEMIPVGTIPEEEVEEVIVEEPASEEVESMVEGVVVEEIPAVEEAPVEEEVTEEQETAFLPDQEEALPAEDNQTN